MSDATFQKEQQEIQQTAAAVEAGTDSIPVPEDLTQETGGEATKDPDSETAKSLWAQIQDMTMPQKVKLALRGNKDARAILIRSGHRLIQRMVLMNPRITEDEILLLAKNRNADEDVLRMIADNREWTSAYRIRAALVENAKTPIAQALRFLPTLGDREIRVLAKSKNVPNVIAVQARKLLFARTG